MGLFDVITRSLEQAVREAAARQRAAAGGFAPPPLPGTPQRPNAGTMPPMPAQQAVQRGHPSDPNRRAGNKGSKSQRKRNHAQRKSQADASAETVAPVPDRMPTAPVASATAAALSDWAEPRTLRSQFILTEILKPPLSLRKGV